MEPKKIKILIVDDHLMIRDGLSLMLKSLSEVCFFEIFEAESGEKALEIVKIRPLDIIIMDYNLPKMNGADTTKKILTMYPKYKILALSNSDELLNINYMINCGARGFILKNVSPIELGKAIDTVLGGQLYYSNEIALKLIAYSNAKTENKRFKNSNRISFREIDVLRFLVQQKSDIEIAELMKISPRTVESHIHNMLSKLQMKNRTNLVTYAIANHIIVD